MEKVFCTYYKKLCKHCSSNNLICNEIEREGISYLDCRYARKSNKKFDVIITCETCGSTDCDSSIIYYPDDNYSQIVYECNNCGNKSE